MNPVRTHLTRTFAGAIAFSALAVPLSVTPVAAAAGTAPGLAKSYTGSAHNSTASASGVLKLTGITQHGTTIAGRVAFEAPLTGSGPFTGTISATAVHFTAHFTGGTVVFKGWVSAVVSMSGSWTAHLTSGGSQVGTWGVGSTWNGSWHDIATDNTSPVAISQLTESPKGVLVGAFIGNGTLSGTVSGARIKFTFSDSVGGTETFVGTVSPLGSMSGTWTDSLGGRRGTGQLQRAGAATSAAI